VDDGNQEFPMPFSRFVETLKGTEDEVWSVWLGKMHGRENHTLGEWQDLIDNYRHQPAHPSALGN
jgi:hypothetical protein